YDRLWGCVACGRILVFDSVSCPGHSSACGVGPVARLFVLLVFDHQTASRDPDRGAAGGYLPPESRLYSKLTGSRPDFAQPPLRGDRTRLAAACDAYAWSGFHQPTAWRTARCAAAGLTKLHPGLAAAHRADCGYDPDLCGRLRCLSAPRDPSVIIP